MTAHPIALALAAIFVLFVLFTAWRFRDSRSLDEYAPDVPADAPLVSVIIPARDEARNIERCLRSVLASTWPALEVIVVDDHSADDTGAIARRIAASAATASAAGVAVNPTRPSERVLRSVKVIDAPDLPAGWFGKQWACHTGAQASRGTFLCFTDADTEHGPELLARSVNAMQMRGATLFTVAGHQELGSFWEKVIQPVVFAMMFSRYGGLEKMSRSTRPYAKIANGQFLLFPRAEYERVGGHESVRDHVAEDLMLAQRVTRMGGAMHMVLAMGHLNTRMYTSLAEIRAGWGKNIFAAGLDTLAVGPITRRILPFVYPFPPLVAAAPALAFLFGALGVLGPGAILFAAITAPVNVLFWVGVYVKGRQNPLWALLHPLGAVMFSWICTEAAWRGTKVSWKGRSYEMGEVRGEKGERS